MKRILTIEDTAVIRDAPVHLLERHGFALRGGGPMETAWDSGALDACDLVSAGLRLGIGRKALWEQRRRFGIPRP